MIPISIKRAGSSLLIITWNNGHEGKFALEHLRKICPCATCQGEDLLLHHYPAQSTATTPESYRLVGIQLVGSYAVHLQWADGHNAGIYTWDHLSANCQCEICAGSRN